MTLTEEQLAALKRVAAYMDEMYSVASPYHGCTEDANILRAMIDSSGTVEPTGGFDLERARGLRDFLQDDCAEVGDVWGDMIAEIERLRGFETAARDLSNDLTRVAKERDELQEANTNFAFQASDQAQEIERLRTRESGLEQRLEWTIRDGFKKQEEQVAKIKELKADLEQSEEIKRLKDELENYGDHYACLLISKDAQIKELEGMLSIRTEELDIAHSAARSEKEMHEKELAAFARRIKELEDALVEKQTALMPSAPRCYADARRQAAIEQLQAEGKIGPDVMPRSWQITEEQLEDALVEERARVITSHPLTHVIDEDRTEASMRLQAEGKIGPDVMPRSWQITEERKEAFGRILRRLEYDQSLPGHTNYKIQRAMELLRAMLEGARQE